MKIKIEFQDTLGQPTAASMARQLIVRVDDAELIELLRALDQRPVYRAFDRATKTVATEGAK